MKRPPSAFRVTGQHRCRWGKCRIPATFGMKLLSGQYQDAWYGCEVHFPRVYELIRPDGRLEHPGDHMLGVGCCVSTPVARPL